ncbi:MAG: polysaccharide deacetylase family protein [Deltaproteobacteria bacterium]|nr:polysaccharide deacetylase family protein [Deltaproteobacteria bacterium]
MRRLTIILRIIFFFFILSTLHGCTAWKEKDYGPIVLDGVLSDWRELDCIDHHALKDKKGCRIYGCGVGDVYIIAINSEETAIDAATTLWLNTDQNNNTGYQIFGHAGGAEYRVEFAADKRPYLFRGGEIKHAIGGPLDHAFSEDRKVVELAIPRDLLGVLEQNINLLVDINDRVFMPANFSAAQFTVPKKRLQERVNLSKRVGIVFSHTTAKHFFHEKTYSKLFMAMQHQAMMAGIPFDLLQEDDLIDIANIVNYDVLLFPYFHNLPKDKLSAVLGTLITASYRYNIGMIACGDFLTHDETNTPFPGDPYQHLKALFGIYRVAGTGPVSMTLRAVNTKHPVMGGYAESEIILKHPSIWYESYKALPGQFVEVLAKQDIEGVSYNAIVATENGGRKVHFSTTELMGYTNLVWKALRWAVFGNDPAVGLQMSRFDNIFTTRIDMDYSQFARDAPRSINALRSMLSDWKNTFNFVGTVFINIGNDPGNNRYTDWGLSAPFYLGGVLAQGSEIGTHSYTHPMNVNTLSDKEIEFEFNQSKQMINERLGIEVIGGAIPGNPENLSVTKILDQYLLYLSGEYSGVDSGYLGAFGYLTPDYQMIYFSPNMYPDLTMIERFKWSTSKAQKVWLDQFAQLTRHANGPIIHWFWHDYGLIEKHVYDVRMYPNMIQHAYKNGSEFATTADIHQRIKNFKKASLTITDTNGLTVIVSGQDLGHFSLKLQTEHVIKNVKDWYAYNDKTIFLDGDGGEYTIHIGDRPDDVTRIISLPMRAELISLSGNGTNLEFTFRGQGNVKIMLSSSVKTTNIQGADQIHQNDCLLELAFNISSMHSVNIMAE